MKTKNKISSDDSMHEDISSTESPQSSNTKKKSKKYKENILSSDIFEISSESDNKIKKKKKKHKNNLDNEKTHFHSSEDASLEKTDSSIQIEEVEVKKRKKRSHDCSDEISPENELKKKKKHNSSTLEIDVDSMETEEILSLDENLIVGKRKRYEDETSSESRCRVKKKKRKDKSQEYVNLSSEDYTERKDENQETDMCETEHFEVEKKKKKKSKKLSCTENTIGDTVENESTVLNKSLDIENDPNQFFSQQFLDTIIPDPTRESRIKSEENSPSGERKKKSDDLNQSESEISAESKSQKKWKMPSISDNALNRLLLRMDKISKENENGKKHSVEKPEIKIQPQLFGESPAITESNSQKSRNMPTISDSALNSLLLKMNEISAQNEEKMQSVRESEAGSQPIFEDQIEHSPIRNLNGRPGENENTNTTQLEDVEVNGSSKKDIEKKEKKMKKNIDYKKLEKMEFVLPWVLPKIHEIVSHPGTKPTPEQRSKLAEAGIKLRTKSKYIKEEDEKIRQNWREFCEHHDWNEKHVEPFLKGSTRSLNGCLSISQFKTFVQFISHNFEDRPMCNIYTRFVRLYSELELENFTPEEDKIILDYLENGAAKKPYAHLAATLNRSIDAVTKRGHKLIKGQLFDHHRIVWDKSLIKELLMNLVEVLDCKNISNLRERFITPEEWRKISSKVFIPPEKLKRVWDHVLYTRIFNSNYEEEYEHIRQDLIERFSSKYKDWREINWAEEAKNYDSFTRLRLYKLFHDLVELRVPKEKRKDLRACLEYLQASPAPRKSGRFFFVYNILNEIETDDHRE